MKYLKRPVMLFIGGVVMCAWFSGTQAEELRIRIPETSGMHLYSPDDYTSLVSFSGEVQLQGQLLLLSQRETVDFVSPDRPSGFEWQVSLLFQPDPMERNKLPHVRYVDEPDKQGEPWLELNYFEKKQLTSVIKAIFGAETAARIGQEVFEVGKSGHLRLKSYRTGIECDQRYHYAEIVSFDSVKDMPVSQVRALTEKMPDCF